jgi:hypothetical protein
MAGTDRKPSIRRRMTQKVKTGVKNGADSVRRRASAVMKGRKRSYGEEEGLTLDNIELFLNAPGPDAGESSGSEAKESKSAEGDEKPKAG